MTDFSRQEVHNFVSYIALILIAVSLPIYKVASSIPIILFTLNWIIEGQFAIKLKKLFNSHLALLFIGFYLIHVFGLFHTVNYDSGKFDLQVKLSLLLLPLICATIPSLPPAKYEKIFLSFVGACLISACVCIANGTIQYFLKGDLNQLFYADLSGILKIHPGYLSMFYNFSIAICAYVLIRKRNTLSLLCRLTLLTLILIFSGMIVLLSSRINIIGLFFTINACFFLYGIEIGRIIRVGSLVLLINIILGYSLFQFDFTKNRMLDLQSIDQMNEPIHWSEWNGINVRLKQWKYSAEVIKDNIVFGVGTGDIKDEIIESYKRNKFGYGAHRKLNVHNQFLETLVGQGLVGFMFLLACIILPLYLSLKRKQYLFSIFLVLIVLNALTESILNTQSGVVFYAFFNSVLAFMKNLDK